MRSTPSSATEGIWSHPGLYEMLSYGEGEEEKGKGRREETGDVTVSLKSWKPGEAGVSRQ